MFDEITEKWRLRARADFFRQHAAHGLAEQFLFHTPGHRRHSQEEAQQALIEQGHAQLDGCAGPACVFVFECARPILAGETGKSNRMQRMAGLGRFLKFPPSAAKIVLLNKVLLQPLRKFRQRVRTAHPLLQPGVKTSPKWRDTSMFEDIPSKRLHDGPKTPLAEEVSQVGPSLAGQDV